MRRRADDGPGTAGGAGRPLSRPEAAEEPGADD